MAYDKEKVYEQSLIAIEDNKLFFVEDVIAYLPCCKATFYDFFPQKSDELNTIKDALEKNKTTIKVSMRAKWYKSENPSLQIALMKMIATDDEAHRLNGSRFVGDITSGGEPVQNVILNLGSGINPETEEEEDEVTS
jgi:hypothetical protein